MNVGYLPSVLGYPKQVLKRDEILEGSSLEYQSSVDSIRNPYQKMFFLAPNGGSLSQ